MATTDQYYGKLDVGEQFAVFDTIRESIPNREAIELFELVSHLSPNQIALITSIAKECADKGASA